MDTTVIGMETYQVLRSQLLPDCMNQTTPQFVNSEQ